MLNKTFMGVRSAVVCKETFEFPALRSIWISYLSAGYVTQFAVDLKTSRLMDTTNSLLRSWLNERLVDIYYLPAKAGNRPRRRAAMKNHGNY